MKLLVILFTLLFTTLAYAGSTQSNVSGSNTAIEGGYTSSTTYQSGSSSNSTTSNTTNSNIRSAPPSAYAPGVNSSGIDVCSTGASMGVQTFGFGLSGSKYFRDENCERIKLSRQLDSMGMKVAAVALLCQDERVFFAMEQAGTPCPFQGKIGKEATDLWKKYDKLRPDYEIYVKHLKIIQKKNREYEKEITKDFNKVDKEVKIEKLKPVNWESPK
jgi:hypothetical protein|tara:strand:- start:199 stop:846 length:648 start_codon:yes stop_codon:yes gene_type:complete